MEQFDCLKLLHQAKPLARLSTLNSVDRSRAFDRSDRGRCSPTRSVRGGLFRGPHEDLTKSNRELQPFLIRDLSSVVLADSEYDRLTKFARSPRQR